MSKTHLYALGADGDLPADAFQPYARGRMRLHGGGGSSGSKNYKNLEVLYGEQAESARLLREQAEKNLPGMVDAYVGRTNQFLDSGYAERQAGQAASDMASANAMERAATERNLASLGVNPNDPRFAGSLRATETSNAARLAAGQNIARNDALKLQHAVAQDAVGTFTGQSNMAAAQMGNASSGLASLTNMQQQAQMNQQAQQQNAIGSAVGGGMALYSMRNSFKDGGRVKAHPGLSALAPGKKVERHSGGGPVGSQQSRGFLSTPTPPAPVQAAAPRTDPVGNAIGTANQVMQAKELYDGVRGVQAAAPVAEAAITPAAELAAGQAAGNGLASVAPGVAPEVGAAASGAGAAAGSTAAGAGAAGAGAAGGAMATVGAALPWVGAAYAVGSLLELWKDGGEVGTQVQDLRDGDKVPGKWEGNTDNVPALLTEGEHVINAEAAKAIGHATLERANNKGLALRKHGKTPKTIKTVGLEALR